MSAAKLHLLQVELKILDADHNLICDRFHSTSVLPILGTSFS
ncbi:hypothetical protein ACZ87_02595 [Candidatus Erwinia dacicola]|uniref:Uncharacterized protein n=1 Tax=Candidatus Erwinia dacicola TaxID=252393 RepID=A0A328TJE4_9GAMM|nr:hypothetical protein ACZ87_02595 [Candidatus Erwinia dacicola]